MLDSTRKMTMFNYLPNLYEYYGQPFYLYDMTSLRQRAIWIRNSLPKRFGVYYSAKANPNLHIIRHVAEIFDGIEVASPGEIAAARLAGVEGSRLLYVGPMKTCGDIAMAYRAGVRRIVVESLDQLQAINALELWDVKIAVRLNPSLRIGSSSIKMGGQSAQFGIDQEQLGQVFNQIRATPNLKFSGYHIYVGTQIEKPSVTLSIIDAMVKVYHQTPKDLRTNIDFLDFGGGFSFPINQTPVPYPIINLANSLDYAVRDIPETVHLCFELGRFVVAPIAVYCTQVQTLKHSKGRDFAICDGGINAFYGFASQSRFKRQNYPFFHIRTPRPKCHSIKAFNGDIVGPLCTPADALASDQKLNYLSEGDILAFKNTGAYGLTQAMPMFLSHCVPLELGFDGPDKPYRLLRCSTQVTDSLRAQGAQPEAIAEFLT